jgi:hypothetical protein
MSSPLTPEVATEVLDTDRRSPESDGLRQLAESARQALIQQETLRAGYHPLENEDTSTTETDNG